MPSLTVNGTDVLATMTDLQNNSGGGGNVDTSLLVQKSGDAMTGNLTTSGDIQAQDLIATNELHVGSTHIISAITDLQNNRVRKSGDTMTGKLTTSGDVQAQDLIATNELHVSGLTQ